MPRCPKHKVRLAARDTEHGKQFYCPFQGCDVVQWDGSTSTPADYATRQARRKAHMAFDTLWKSKSLSRGQAYTLLAKFMRLPKRSVHIGMFNVEQCAEVLRFVNERMPDWVFHAIGRK